MASNLSVVTSPSSEELSGLSSLSADKDMPSAFGKGSADAPSKFRGEPVNKEENHDKIKIFNNKSELKILISEIAMHLTPERRKDLFKQIDELLDVDDWMEEDSLIDPHSFRSFLRFVIYAGDVKRPSLTVTNSGNLGASWLATNHRLTIEFMRHDLVRMVLHLRTDPEADSETCAFQGSLKRIDAILQPFEAQCWYLNGSA